MSLRDRDFDFFFALDDHAVTATTGGASFPVLFDEFFDQTYMRDMFDYQTERVGMASQARQVQAVGKTSDIPALEIGAMIAIEGKEYELLKIYPIEDGALTRLEMATNYAS